MIFQLKLLKETRKFSVIGIFYSFMILFILCDKQRPLIEPSASALQESLNFEGDFEGVSLSPQQEDL